MFLRSSNSAIDHDSKQGSGATRYVVINLLKLHRSELFNGETEKNITNHAMNWVDNKMQYLVIKDSVEESAALSALKSPLSFGTRKCCEVQLILEPAAGKAPFFMSDSQLKPFQDRSR